MENKYNIYSWFISNHSYTGGSISVVAKDKETAIMLAKVELDEEFHPQLDNEPSIEIIPEEGMAFYDYGSD